MSLLLFDIDGTLLLSGGAGVRAMTRAFAEVFGVADAFAASDVAGRTDTYILTQALERAGIAAAPADLARFRERYVSLLREEIRRPPSGRCGLMPGVAPLLAAVQRQTGVHLALLTGNFEPAAYVKLAHFGVDAFFSWGAFGEESADRNDLGRAALRQAEARGIPPRAREHAVIIGDTPHDIVCAREIGARALAVATGAYSRAALHDAGADAVVDTLEDTGAMVEWLLEAPRR